MFQLILLIQKILKNAVNYIKKINRKLRAGHEKKKKSKPGVCFKYIHQNHAI